MRTTITLEDDVVAMLGQLRRSRQQSFKDVVNEALREGLKEMQRPAKRTSTFRTKPLDAGQPFLSNMDNVAEVISIAEGDWHK